MRITAGILMILGGFIGGSLLVGILNAVGWIGTFWPGFLAVIGGAMALRRVHYKWALVGAICSLLFPPFGIPAIILLIKSRGEFE